MLAKKTYKNQITIPKEALKGLEEVEYFDVYSNGVSIVLTPVVISSHAERLHKIREKIRALGLTEKEIEESVRSARETSH